MASTSGTQGEELTKGMVSIVEFMLKVRDREALIDKAVDRTVDIARGFGSKNITDFLATYRNEMQQRDVNNLKQISSFKRVVESGIRERIMEIQNEHATWTEFEKVLLAEYMLEDASRMN
jgi:ferritin